MNPGLLGHCQTPRAQLPLGVLSLPKGQSSLGSLPSEEITFSWGPGGHPVSCLWHFRGERKHDIVPMQGSPTLIFHIHNETSERTTNWGSQGPKLVFENVKVGEDKVSVT